MKRLLKITLNSISRKFYFLIITVSVIYLEYHCPRKIYVCCFAPNKGMSKNKVA